jgi:hypothetical protein
MSRTPLSRLATTGHWQSDFLAVLPTVKSHAQFCFRRLPAWHRAEMTAETIARAFVDYGALARRRKLSRAYPSTLAAYAVKEVRSQRRVGGHLANRDVMSPALQQRQGFGVGPLARWCGGEGWRDMVLESRRVSPADQACFNVDFRVWLGQWPQRQRRIINSLAAGHSTKDVAHLFGISEPRISQLRREYQHSWEQFQVGTAA